MAAQVNAVTPRSIFLAAILLPDDQARQVFVDLACGENTSMKEMVCLLLSARQHGEASPIDAAVQSDTGATALSEMDDGERGEYLTPPRFSALAAENIELATHSQIGPYKLLEQIGQGGFGTVYMAEQTIPVRRKVALKIIKPGMETREVITRFEAERQALAMMDHPHIARVLDGGATSEGRPYFVMELVRGIPLTKYCDEAILSTEERLVLFIDVCRAVQHAHQKGIIHRDLKPANVLVTMYDDKAVAKVIDFGIAKAIGQTLTDRTLFTGYQQLLGTPQYMSPEQAQMSGIDIDTRSDIYSLGVMLYELLTGTTPFTKGSLSNVSFDELRRIIREVDPPRPSDRLTTLDARARSTIADRRRIDHRKISEELRGELDWIVMKSLEKDRNRRYESASVLAEEIQRYLNDEPVLACPPSLGYRLGKSLRRHRAGVSWGLASFAAALMCIALIAYPRFREAERIAGVRQQVELALREVRTAIEAGDLALADKSLGNAKTLVSRDRQGLPSVVAQVEALASELQQRQSDQVRYDELLAKARDAQDRMTYDVHLQGDNAAEATLNTSFGVLERDDWLQYLESTYLTPDQNARVRETVYETLLCLADHGPRWVKTDESARRSLELLELAESFHAPTKALHWVRSECHQRLNEVDARDRALEQYNDTPATTALDHYLPGHTAGWRGNRAAAIEAYRAALRLQPDHYNSLFFLADRLAVDKHHAEAIAYYTGCIAQRPNHVFAIVSRGEAYEELGDRESAELDYLAATEASIPAKDHVYAFGQLLEYYRRTWQHEKHAEAIAHYKSDIVRLTKEQTGQAGPDDDSTLQLITELGVQLCNAFEYTDGILLLERVLERRRSLYSGAHQRTLLSLTYLAECLVGSDRAPEAIGLFEEALAMSMQLHGPHHQTTLMVMSDLGHQYATVGQVDRGIQLLEDALVKLESMGESENRVITRERLGYAYKQAQKWDKAIPMLRQNLAQRVKDGGLEHDSTLVATWLLGSALDQAGLPDEAVPLLEESLERHSRQIGADATSTLLVLNDLAVALIHVGRPDDAIPLLTRCVDVRRRDKGPEHPKTLVATFNLAAATLAAERYDIAVDQFEQLLETHTRLHGADAPETLQASAALLQAFHLAGRRDEFKRLAQSHLGIVRKLSDEIQLSSALANAADALLTFEEFAEAEPLARECLQIRADKLPDTWLCFNAQSLLGGALLGQEKYDEAEPLLLQAMEGLDRHEEKIPPGSRVQIQATLERLVKLYEATDDSQKAAHWATRLPANWTE